MQRDLCRRAFRRSWIREQKGIRGDDLISAMHRRGWGATSFRGDAPLAQRSLEARRPLIALIEDRPGRFHYVVIVSWASGKVVVHDPARRPFQVLEEQAFLRKWERSGYWTLLALPPSALAEKSAHVDEIAGGADWRRLRQHRRRSGAAGKSRSGRGCRPAARARGGAMPGRGRAMARTRGRPRSAEGLAARRGRSEKGAGDRSSRRACGPNPRNEPLPGRRHDRRARGVEPGGRADGRSRRRAGTRAHALRGRCSRAEASDGEPPHTGRADARRAPAGQHAVGHGLERQLHAARRRARRRSRPR